MTDIHRNEAAGVALATSGVFLMFVDVDPAGLVVVGILLVLTGVAARKRIGPFAEGSS